MIKRLSPLFFSCILLVIGCTTDQIPPPQTECFDAYNYRNDIEEIIETSCAYSGCHVSGTPGIIDYSNYDGLTRVIKNGTFRERVLVQMNMPPSNASGPTSLSQEQKNTIRCWLDQGYPE